MTDQVVRPDGTLEFTLTYRPPLDWEGMLSFLAARAIPGVEAVAGGVYRRTVALAGARGTMEVRCVPERALLRATIPGSFTAVLPEVARRVERIFDLAAAPDVIAAHLARDPLLEEAVRAHPGLRVPGSWDAFETGVRAIIGQVVSVRAATGVAARLAAGCGELLPAAHGTGPMRLFPTPERLSRLPLGGLGLSEGKARAVAALAKAVASGDLRFEELDGLDDAVARLTALPGIGPWTAHYVAMRGLGEADAFPAGDLVLQRAAGASGERELAARAASWRPWRAYAAMLLWTTYAAGGRGPGRRSPGRGRRTAEAEDVHDGVAPLRPSGPEASSRGDG